MIYTVPAGAGTVSVTQNGVTKTVGNNTGVPVVAGPLVIQATPNAGYVFDRWWNTWSKPGYPTQTFTSSQNPLNDSSSADAYNEQFTAYFMGGGGTTPPPDTTPTQESNIGTWLVLGALGFAASQLLGKGKRR